MMMPERKVQISITVPVHKRLVAVQAEIKAEKGGREVTLPEVIDLLIDARERERAGT